MLFCPISPLDTGSQQPNWWHFSSSETTIKSRLNALGAVNSRPEDTRWVPSRDHYDTTQNMFTGWISNPFTGSLPLWEDGQPISIPIFFLWKNSPLFFVAGYDGADIRVRFWNWWHRGYNNAFRRDWFPAHPFGPSSECLPCIKLWWLVNIFLLAG